MSEASSLDLRSFEGFEESRVVDTSEGLKMFLLVGKNGSQVQVTPSAYHLLQAIRSGMTFPELAQVLSAKQKRRITPAQLEEAYRGVVDKLAEIERKASERDLPWGFWVKFRLLSEKLVVRLTRHLTFLYHPIVAISLLAALAAVAVSGFVGNIHLGINDGAFLTGYCLFLASLIFHELGHASACARYGARPSDIGFTIYLMFPAFYSDVSSAWKLARWQRVVVDLGGSYFQFIVGAVYVVAFQLTGWDPLRLAVVMIISSSVFSLNPIFKFDGYWVFADALGVTNLGRQPARIGKHFLDRLRGRTVKPLPWPVSVAQVLMLYSIASVLVWGYFVSRIFPILWTRLQRYPAHIDELWAQLLQAGIPTWASARSFLISTLLLLVSCLMVFQLASRLLLPLLKRLWTSRSKDGTDVDTATESVREA
jgi:putative peptide zinc metalloprotease protein